MTTPTLLSAFNLPLMKLSAFHKTLFLAIAASITFSPYLWCANEILIQNVVVTKKADDKYMIAGKVTNKSAEPRELVFRGQLTFYDRTAPEGDKPVMILRRDVTKVIKAGQTRSVRIPLIDEGATEMTSLRAEPMLRVRRNRVWNY